MTTGGKETMGAVRQLLAKSSALIDPKPNPKGYDGKKATGNKAPRKKIGKPKGVNAHGTHSAEPNASPMGNPDPGLTHCASCGAKLEMRGKHGKGSGQGPNPKGCVKTKGGRVSHMKSLMPHAFSLTK